MIKLLLFLFFSKFSLCGLDDDEGFGWGFDEEDEQKEIDWDNVKVHDVIILGSGPAGSTAALYLARAGYSPLVLHGHVPGGQLVYTTEIENYPGFNGTGPQLVKYMQKQAEAAGAQYILDMIEEVNLTSSDGKRLPLFTLKSSNNVGYKCRTLIIATGASAKYLGLESEQRLRNRGVSACAVCDGALYRDQPVAVVGGGDAAIEEALYLNKFCKSVKLIHRRDKLRASLPMKKKLEKSTVEVIWDSIVTEVIGDEYVTGIQLKNVKTEKIINVELSALFLAIGHTPATELFKGKLELEPDGYIKTNGTPQTSVPGVFAAGDCADRVFRQAITSAGTGCQAALLAERYLIEYGSSN